MTVCDIVVEPLSKHPLSKVHKKKPWEYMVVHVLPVHLSGLLLCPVDVEGVIVDIVPALNDGAAGARDGDVVVAGGGRAPGQCWTCADSLPSR